MSLGDSHSTLRIHHFIMSRTQMSYKGIMHSPEYDFIQFHTKNFSDDFILCIFYLFLFSRNTHETHMKYSLRFPVFDLKTLWGLYIFEVRIHHLPPPPPSNPSVFCRCGLFEKKSRNSITFFLSKG